MSTLTNFTESDGWFASEDKDFIFIVVDENAVVMDITGWTIKFSLSTTDGGANVAGFPKTAYLTTPLAGLCTVTIAKSDTANLSEQDYFYTLWRADFGSYALLAHGTATLQAGETVVP